jgi:hypothetical protein
MKYATLDYIVRNVIVSLEESSLRRYQTYLQYCIRGVRELNLFAGSVPKTVHLPMLANKAINLPSDYVKYVKIGICINGRIVTLGLDDSLCLNDNYGECGDPLEVVIANLDNNNYSWLAYGYPFLSYYHNNQWVEGLFGVGGGFNSRGYYKENPEKNQIQFTSNVPSTEIILEYISDGVREDGSAVVPMEAVEYLINFVHWKRVEAKHDSTESEIARWREMSRVAYNNYKHFHQMFSVEEYLDSYRKNVQQLPKR